MRDHDGAMIVTSFFIPPPPFMLQLAAAVPGVFMPLFMLPLEIIRLIVFIIILIIMYLSMANSALGPRRKGDDVGGYFRPLVGVLGRLRASWVFLEASRAKPGAFCMHLPSTSFDF